MDPAELQRLDLADKVEEAEAAILQEYRVKYPGAPFEPDVIDFLENRLKRLVAENRETDAWETLDRLERWTRAYVASGTSGGEAAAFLYQVKPIFLRCQALVSQRFPPRNT